LQDVVIPKAQDVPPGRCNASIAQLIAPRKIVLSAISLDNQPGLNASEVNDVRRDRELPPESPA
jgi:hypothetical protein